MAKYYTRACNFFYGKKSKIKVKHKSSLPIGKNNFLSFDKIEIISRQKKRKIHINKIHLENKELQKKIKTDLKLITRLKKFDKLNFKNIPLLMGVLNLTPDSFSDGGKYNDKKKALSRAKELIRSGCKILDIGGESTRPGSKQVEKKIEWERIKQTINQLNKSKTFISLDTRKSEIMKKGILNNVNLINDVSGLKHDPKTIMILKKTQIPFILHHMKGNPETMQKNPKYKNVLLDIYDFFEKKISEIRRKGIYHNNIILDPGIGFGKNLKHNLTILRGISIFHSLGFPIMLGISRKKFIKELSGINDSKKRIGGTISSTLHAMTQGVHILRVHDANEINQSIKVFKSLYLN